MGSLSPAKSFSQGQIGKIPIDYDKPEAIAKVIEAAKFGWKYVKLSPTEIPFVGAVAGCEVREVHFNRVMYNRDLQNALKQRGEELGFKGFKFVDPLVALSFVCISKEQRQHQLVALFTDNDQLWCLCLLGGAGGCWLRVYEYNPEDNWDKAVCFLAVPAE